MRRMVAVPAVAMTMLALGATAAPAQGPPTLAAAGEGRTDVRPDVADLYLQVSRVRATSRAARRAANRRVVRIRGALRGAGIANADVQTNGVGVDRRRVRRRDRPDLVRFRASASFTVTSRDVPGLGDLIDAVSDAGADEVFGPEFSLGDRSAAEIEATRIALEDARRRADDAAARLGLRVTGVASVNLAPLVLDDFGGVDDSGGNGLERSSSEGRTRVAPGRITVGATVRVVYTVAPAA